MNYLLLLLIVYVSTGPSRGQETAVQTAVDAIRQPLSEVFYNVALRLGALLGPLVCNMATMTYENFTRPFRQYSPFSEEEDLIKYNCQFETFRNFYINYRDDLQLVKDDHKIKNYNETRTLYAIYPDGREEPIGNYPMGFNCFTLRSLYEFIGVGEYGLVPTYPNNLTVANAATAYIFKQGVKDPEAFTYFSIKEEGAKSLLFDPNKRTNIVIHGWTDRRVPGGWMDTIKDVAHKKVDDNLILLDWSKRSQSVLVNKVTSNTKVVAFELFEIIRWLSGGTFSNFNVLAHSYGGQIGGQLGNRMSASDPKKPLLNIYAIDPSDVCFGRSFASANNPLPYNWTLNSRSAGSVVVLHTFTALYGAHLGLGIIDIFLNGGDYQPDCPLLIPFTLRPIDDFAYWLTCGHYYGIFMAMTDYQAVGSGDCKPIAYSCESYDTFREGRCTVSHHPYFGLKRKVVDICKEIVNLNDNLVRETWPSPPNLASALAGYAYQIGADRNKVMLKVTYTDQVSCAGKLQTLFVSTMRGPPYCAYHFGIKVNKIAIPRLISTVVLEAEGSNNRTYKLTMELSKLSTGLMLVSAKDYQPAPFKTVKLHINDWLGQAFGWPTQVSIDLIAINYMSHWDQKVTSSEYPGNLNRWYFICNDTHREFFNLHPSYKDPPQRVRRNRTLTFIAALAGFTRFPNGSYSGKPQIIDKNAYCNAKEH